MTAQNKFAVFTRFYYAKLFTQKLSEFGNYKNNEKTAAFQQKQL